MTVSVINAERNRMDTERIHHLRRLQKKSQEKRVLIARPAEKPAPTRGSRWILGGLTFLGLIYLAYRFWQHF